MSHKTTTFDTFEQFLEQVQKPGIFGSGYELSCKPNNAGWSGTRCFNDALDLAEKGWPEGLRRIQALRGDLLSHQGAQEERFMHTYAESGDEVDVGRYLSGEPECMMEYQTQFVPSVGRVIKLVVNCAASAGNTSEMIFNRGAAAVALTDLIENAGLRTEVWLAAGVMSQCGHNICDTFIRVKAPEQPAELDRLAFILAHASTLRRFMLRLFEQKSNEDFIKYHGNDSYGRPRDVEVEPGTVYIGALQHSFGKQINTREDCTRFIQETLNQYLLVTA